MADTEFDEQNYKGFDLTEFADPEKVQALIDFLELDGENDTVTEDGNDYYSINHRRTKRGTSPARYVEVITAFKKLLTPKQRDKINSFLKLISEMEECECGKVREKLYNRLKSTLEKQKLNRAKDIKEAWTVCERDALHVVNIAWHLLWLPSNHEKDEPDYVLSYREAWFGQTPKDRREDSSDDDGQYLVLTDSEADSRADDSLDDYLWEQAVAAHQTTMGLDDWKEWVLNCDGRGPQLASYDSCENDVDVDGTTYYIYRTN